MSDCNPTSGCSPHVPLKPQIQRLSNVPPPAGFTARTTMQQQQQQQSFTTRSLHSTPSQSQPTSPASLCRAVRSLRVNRAADGNDDVMMRRHEVKGQGLQLQPAAAAGFTVSSTQPPLTRPATYDTRPWRPLKLSQIPQSVLDAPPQFTDYHQHMRHKSDTSLTTQFGLGGQTVNNHNSGAVLPIHRRFSEAIPPSFTNADVSSPNYTISPITGEIKRPRARKFPRDFWDAKAKDALKRGWRRDETKESDDKATELQSEEEMNSHPSAYKANFKEIGKAAAEPIVEKVDSELSADYVELNRSAAVSSVVSVASRQRANRLLLMLCIVSVLLMSVAAVALNSKQSAMLATLLMLLLGGLVAMRVSASAKLCVSVNESMTETNPVNVDKSSNVVLKTDKLTPAKPIHSQTNSPQQFESRSQATIAAKPSSCASSSIVEQNHSRKELD